jgi:hypothetical protein
MEETGHHPYLMYTVQGNIFSYLRPFSELVSAHLLPESSRCFGAEKATLQKQQQIKSVMQQPGHTVPRQLVEAIAQGDNATLANYLHEGKRRATPSYVPPQCYCLHVVRGSAWLKVFHPSLRPMNLWRTVPTEKHYCTMQHGMATTKQ